MSVTTTTPRVIAAGCAALLATGLLGLAAGSDAATPGAPKTAGSYGSGESLRPGDALVSGETNDHLFSAGLPTGPLTRGDDVLIVQEDGNVVEYERTSETSGQAIWSTGTAGVATPVRLTFQTDGNVVLHDATNTARWQSGTAGRPAQHFGVYGNGQVVTQDANGGILAAVGPVTTPLPGMTVGYANSRGTAGDHVLTVQDDGNVVAYRYDFVGGTPARAYWSTGTAGAGRVRFVAQADGNLVVYRLSDGRAIWQSGSRGPSGYHQFDVQADRNVVLYRTDGQTRLGAIWASGTRA